MSGKLTKNDLRTIYAHLTSLRPPGPRPLNAEQLVELDKVTGKIQYLIEISRAAPERGELLFSWRVPRDWALTMNEYAYTKGWRKKKIRDAMDVAVRALLPQFPKALTHGSHLRRWLRLTRFSTKRVDDLSIDVLGGKMCVDALVRCGVLEDDDHAHVIREPRWEKTKPGNTHVLVEVFSVVAEHQASPAPADARITQLERPKLGLFTEAILSGR